MRDPRLLFALGLLLVGCPSGSADDDDDEPTPPEPAPLAERSDDECPDLAAPGLSTFSSAGIDRNVAVYFPDGDTEGLPILFFWHGLTTPAQDPVGNAVAGLQLDDLADDWPAIVVVPEARPTTMPLVGEVSLWGIFGDAEPDLTLFDDLRTCVADELGGDVRRLHSMGFSGGALWTTQILMSRSDTLASAVEFSGGAEIDVPLDGGPFLLYETPSKQTPTLLTSGGADDSWPQGLTIIDFTVATDTLQGGLRVDGHFVVRCEHEEGHTVPQEGWEFGLEWVEGHEYGVASPIQAEGIEEQESWCRIAD